MDLRDEVRKIRPSWLGIMSTLVKVLALLAIIGAYYRYIEEEPSASMPAVLVCVACLAFAFLGKFRTELRYRILLGRLLKRIEKQ